MRLRGSVLTITDTGIGIPEEEIARVYQPFYRASNTREFAGHGIGLSLSMRILRSYGARITITSEVGKGTTVEMERMAIFVLLDNTNTKQKGETV